MANIQEAADQLNATLDRLAQNGADVTQAKQQVTQLVQAAQQSHQQAQQPGAPLGQPQAQPGQHTGSGPLTDQQPGERGPTGQGGTTQGGQPLSQPGGQPRR